MQLAVVLVDRRALAAYHSHPHVLSSEALGAGLDLVPLFIVARDLVRSIPGEIALDLVFANERAHERLVSFGEPPDAQGILFAVASARRDEVLRDAREQEACVPPARCLCDGPRLEKDRPDTRAREVIGRRDPGDPSTDDRDVGDGVFAERCVPLAR